VQSSGQQEKLCDPVPFAGESAQHHSRHAADGASAQAGADIAYGLTASEHQGKDRRCVTVTSSKTTFGSTAISCSADAAGYQLCCWPCSFSLQCSGALQ
jgi:hypothetical protein